MFTLYLLDLFLKCYLWCRFIDEPTETHTVVLALWMNISLFGYFQTLFVTLLIGTILAIKYKKQLILARNPLLHSLIQRGTSIYHHPTVNFCHKVIRFYGDQVELLIISIFKQMDSCSGQRFFPHFS
jgi:hypothetical protein